jgi:RNA polymerase sigma-70 factor (ECF subfamily)
MVLGLSRLKNDAVFEPWLLQIARNECRDHLRKKMPARRLLRLLGRQHERIAVDTSVEVEIVAALTELGREERELLALATDKPRSYQSLAQFLHLSLPALKSRLFRLRARLDALMAKENGS